MRRAGGRSPQLQTIQAQAKALQEELENRGVAARTFIAMRYWTPFAEDAIESIKAENIQKLVILPLYPQFSLSTSGFGAARAGAYAVQRPRLPRQVVGRACLVQPARLPTGHSQGNRLDHRRTASGEAKDAHILYTAQGLPKKYVEDLSDPYQEQVERSIELVRAELAKLGIANKDSLSYQGAFGPTQLRWLEPSTKQQIRDLAASGERTLVLVPISFVFEHMATLNEMDMEFAELRVTPA